MTAISEQSCRSRSRSRKAGSDVRPVVLGLEGGRHLPGRLHRVSRDRAGRNRLCEERRREDHRSRAQKTAALDQMFDCYSAPIPAPNEPRQGNPCRRCLDRKRRSAQVAVLTTVATLAAGCTNTLLYGESTEFDLAIHVNDNPQQPLEVNIGLKRHVAESHAAGSDRHGSRTATTRPRGRRSVRSPVFALRYQDRDRGCSTISLSGLSLPVDTPRPSWRVIPRRPSKVMNADFEHDASTSSRRGAISAGAQRISTAAIDELNQDAGVEPAVRPGDHAERKRRADRRS